MKYAQLPMGQFLSYGTKVVSIFVLLLYVVQYFSKFQQHFYNQKKKF